jgi:hypothetical protein
MINIVLSITCFVMFKFAFLRLFASRRTNTNQAAAPTNQSVLSEKSFLKEVQTNTH